MTDFSLLTLPHRHHQLAYVQTLPTNDLKEGCQVLFLTGFRSDMQGTKAVFLEEWAKKTGRGFVRFDYTGHGQSQGDFEALTVSDWVQDASDILQTLLKDKPVVIIGSSMGGWIGMLLCRLFPDQVQGFIGLAAAPDMTHALMWETFDDETQEKLMSEGKIAMDCEYDPENPYIITRQLIEDGANHLLLTDETLDLDLPIRLIHGQQDQDVPWQLSVHVMQSVVSENVALHLIKDGDHRLSRPQDLLVLSDTVTHLVDNIDEVNTLSNSL